MKAGRRIMMVFMAMVLVLSGVFVGDLRPAMAEEKSVFSDVPVDHQYYEAIKWVKSRGVNGYGDGTFKPDRQITKFEMAQMHYALFGKGWFGEKEADIVAVDNQYRVLNAPKGNWRYLISHYAVSNLGRFGFFSPPVLSDKYISYAGTPYILGVNLNFNEKVTEEALALSLSEYFNLQFEHENWKDRVSDTENGWVRAERINRMIAEDKNFKAIHAYRDAHGKANCITKMTSGYFMLNELGLKTLPLTKENILPARPITRAEVANVYMLLEQQCNENNTTGFEMYKKLFTHKVADEYFIEQEIANPD